MIDWFSINFYDNREATEAHFSVHNDGQGATLLAKQGDEIAGYVTVGISWLEKIPLIAEFAVMELYSRHGLGSRLLDLAETYIKENLGDKVVLWVPIVSALGPAQRLYVKRGYIPDGSGVVKDGVSVEEGAVHM